MRKRFGGMGRAQLSEMKSLEKENDEPLERHWSERQWRMLKKIVAELELDKLRVSDLLCNRPPVHAEQKGQRGAWERRSTTMFWTSS